MVVAAAENDEISAFISVLYMPLWSRSFHCDVIAASFLYKYSVSSVRSSCSRHHTLSSDIQTSTTDNQCANEKNGSVLSQRACSMLGGISRPWNADRPDGDYAARRRNWHSPLNPRLPREVTSTPCHAPHRLDR